MPRIRRRRNVADQSRSATLPDVKTSRAVARMMADRKTSLLPTDAGLDQLSDVTDDDIERAVTMWDAAQAAAHTGLVGMLDARLDDA